MYVESSQWTLFFQCWGFMFFMSAICLFYECYFFLESFEHSKHIFEWAIHITALFLIPWKSVLSFLVYIDDLFNCFVILVYGLNFRGILLTTCDVGRRDIPVECYHGTSGPWKKISIPNQFCVYILTRSFNTTKVGWIQAFHEYFLCQLGVSICLPIFSTLL